MHYLFYYRRLVRRIYIPLPDPESRRSLVRLLLERQGPSGTDMLGPAHMERIVRMTEGYSGSDLTAVSDNRVTKRLPGTQFI